MIHTPDIIGTESWLNEEISNAEVFLGWLHNFHNSQTLAVECCLLYKNYITCAELWVNEVYEMIAVEVNAGTQY
jgi:hypothetical protein